jgi:hypothetical protein
MGFQHVIKFNRPVNRKAFVKVNLTLNPEETFPSGGDLQVQKNIIDFGNVIQIGADVIIQKFYSPIYAVSGILNAALYMSIPTFEVDDLSGVTGMTALFSALTILKGSALVIGDQFNMGIATDTTDNVLLIVKTLVTPIAINDTFQVTNVITPALLYIGNINLDITPYKTTGYFSMSPVEAPFFNTDSTIINFVP